MTIIMVFAWICFFSFCIYSLFGHNVPTQNRKPKMTTNPQLAKRNNSISYIKGCAILGVILIHLFDWSEIQWSAEVKNVKELLYPFVMLFIATAGSLMVIASRKYDMGIAAKRLVKRGLEIFGVYFLYNITKLYIYNFAKQPFYLGALDSGQLTLGNILQLKIFTVPISILLTIAFFVVLSPLILSLLRKIKYPKAFLLFLVGVLLLVNYAFTVPSNAVTDFLYSKNYILFPLALWAVPFLLGMFLALLDLEQYKLGQIAIWGSLTIVTYSWWRYSGHSSWQPSSAMYPLHPYYIAFSFFFMFVLIAIFAKLEKYKSPFLNRILATLQVYGDNTLELYILHWLVIDLTSWLLFAYMPWIWLIMPLFFVAYSFWNRQKIDRYFQNLMSH